MAVTGNSFSSTSRDLSQDRTVSGQPPAGPRDKVLDISVNQPTTNPKGTSDFNAKSRGG